MSVIDGSRATASGDGLRICGAKQRANFKVKTSHVGVADLAVTITCKLDTQPINEIDKQYMPASINGTALFYFIINWVGYTHLETKCFLTTASLSWHYHHLS